MDPKVLRTMEGLEALGKWGRRGLNAEVARSTGFTPSYVGQVWKGLKNPADKFLIAICEAFGIRREWVFDGQEPILDPPFSGLAKKAMEILVSRRLPATPGNTTEGAERYEISGALKMEDAEKLLYDKFGEGILAAHKTTVTAMIDLLTLSELQAVMGYIKKILDDRRSG